MGLQQERQIVLNWSTTCEITALYNHFRHFTEDAGLTNCLRVESGCEQNAALLKFEYIRH